MGANMTKGHRRDMPAETEEVGQVAVVTLVGVWRRLESI